jgi:predicted DNA binding CopG/RHH family protein
MPRTKQLAIPKFSSEAEEASWWDSHRSDIEADIRQRMKQKRLFRLRSVLAGTRPSQPVTLRIPKEDLENARRQAAKKGLRYQTYIKMLLREALTAAGLPKASVPHASGPRFPKPLLRRAGKSEK